MAIGIDLTAVIEVKNWHPSFTPTKKLSDPTPFSLSASDSALTLSRLAAA